MKCRIVKVFGKFYTVDNHGDRINCVLRGKLKQDPALERFSEPVAVGDYAECHLEGDGAGVIDEIYERRNVFTRKDRSRDKEDIIAANIDQVIVVQSFMRPKLNLRFVDRVLVRCARENIPCLLCINKKDLSQEKDHIFIRDYYSGTDVPVYSISALTGDGIDDFKKELDGRLSIFVGYSGVGKSTILNRLFPGIDLRTTEVSDSTGKGRHTTTNVELVAIDEDTCIIDTPGVREFGLVDIEPEELSVYFEELNECSASCNFKSCTHDHEPDCEVKRMVEEGHISEERYISYLNILHSLQEDRKRRYK